jgi:RHS repeat-associated protein
LGSIVAVTNASGTVLNKNSYGPFGESNPSGSIFGFTGQRYDTETGLYNFPHRYYSPSIGRFLQPDVIGYADGYNQYTYTNNNPVSFNDPLGLFLATALGAAQIIPANLFQGTDASRLITAINALSVAFQQYLSTKGQMNVPDNNVGMGNLGETLTEDFLTTKVGIQFARQVNVAFSGTVGYTVADLVLQGNGGYAIGEVKTAKNRMPSIMDLTWPQSAAMSAIEAGQPGTRYSQSYNNLSPFTTFFSQYDLFEIDFVPVLQVSVPVQLCSKIIGG